MGWPGIAEQNAARLSGESAAARLALRPMRAHGAEGGAFGSGAGSSVEYQDHRPYAPGDDPRHLDWAAAGRSEALFLRTFRREVTPRLDLAIDLSHSMALPTDKAIRTLELTHFVRAVADRAHWALSIHVVVGAEVKRVEPAALLTDRWLPEGEGALGALDLRRIPWRSSARRVLISDLLHEVSPAVLLAQLTGPGSESLLLVPHAEDERDPSWSGELELVDVESGRARAEAITPELLERHHRAYTRHFELWRTEARRVRVTLLRVRAEGPLFESLAEEGLATGAVSPWI